MGIPGVSYSPTGPGPLLVGIHGAGACSASFAPLFALLPTPQLRYDLRLHASPPPSDCSLVALATDLVQLLHRLEVPTTTPLVLVAHSLGAAVATHAAPLLARDGWRVSAVVVIDLVEGTALAALAGMQRIVERRPTAFSSIEDAIRWTLESRTLNNEESARISVPPLLRKVGTSVTSTSTRAPPPSASSDTAPSAARLRNPRLSALRGAPPAAGGTSLSGLAENESLEEESPEEPVPVSETTAEALYEWITDLSATSPFWTSWFSGFNASFLALPSSTAKLLLLANVETLDKDLIVASMMGQFQCVVVKDGAEGPVGHYIHEDAPRETAQIISSFVERTRAMGMSSEEILRRVKKVGQA